VSKKRDELTVRTIGNLISSPKLIEDGEGNKICYCRIATNPRARKFDKETNRELTKEERNRSRTIAELKITNTAMAELFHRNMNIRDRVEIVGEGGTKQVEKLFWSNKNQDWVTLTIDVDEDGKNIQTIMEDRLIVYVKDFTKILLDGDIPEAICV